LNDCLVTNDIGIFAYDSEYSRLGNACGVVVGADHFKVDHVDSICTGEYSKNVDVSGLSKKERFKVLLNVDVQVTQHAGGDSDRWLLHELDAEFRNYYGIPGKSYGPEKIDGNTILQDDVAGVNYRWLSGNKVIEIKYRDPDMNKPEPLEVVKAYLAKHPSTITSFILQELRNSTNVTKWIKDEIDRRLWLCDKWNAQFQSGGVTQKDLLYNLNRSLSVFLNYRHKYYNVSTDDELAAELAVIRAYMNKSDLTSMLNKLTEYKTWWTKHKAKSIRI
jgi:hypothetical protein